LLKFSFFLFFQVRSSFWCFTGQRTERGKVARHPVVVTPAFSLVIGISDSFWPFFGHFSIFQVRSSFFGVLPVSEQSAVE